MSIKSSGAQLRELRQARELSQIELAKRAGISRQALGAIEADTYQPGVDVALRLAGELGTTVEALFGRDREDRLTAELGHSAGGEVAARVSLARIGGRLVAIPVPATCVMLTPASGLVERSSKQKRVEVLSFRTRSEIDATLVIAGCDPGVSILRDYLARRQPSIEVAAVPGSSHDALISIRDGSAHAAGVHLRDPKTGGYNVAAAREVFGPKRFRMVNFARWELGLATRTDSSIKDASHLTRRGVRLINRASGSGARAVLDEVLVSSDIDGRTISGYDKLAAGHLEVAAAIAGGVADAGVTIRLAADLYGLGFQPWREERYDLVIPEREFDWAPVRQLMEALNSSLLAREISQLCAYDTAQMGRVESLLA